MKMTEAHPTEMYNTHQVREECMGDIGTDPARRVVS